MISLFVKEKYPGRDLESRLPFFRRDRLFRQTFLYIYMAANRVPFVFRNRDFKKTEIRDNSLRSL